MPGTRGTQCNSPTTVRTVAVPISRAPRFVSSRFAAASPSFCHQRSPGGDGEDLAELACPDHDRGSGEIAGEHRGGQQPGDDGQPEDGAQHEESRRDQREHRGQCGAAFRRSGREAADGGCGDYRDRGLGSDVEVSATADQRVEQQRAQCRVEAGHR
jgi:hypothetical protein